MAAGVVPPIYSYPSFWSCLGGTTAFARTNPFWVANWDVSAPNLFGGWSGYTIWQYSTTGTVPGVAGSATDVDVFNGTLDQLKQFAAGATPHQVTGVDSAGLAVQSQPHVNHVLRYAANGATLYLTCQTVHGDQADNAVYNGKPFTTWDQLSDGTWVYDWYMNTPTVAASGYSPGIAPCAGG